MTSPPKVPTLIISGCMGAGKTTVLSEVSDLLAEARVPHAAIDLDWICQMYPSQPHYGERLMSANLAAIWPSYVAAGAERLVVARVVETAADLPWYPRAVPGAELTVCRLEASVETMRERIRVREPGMIQAHAVARSAELAEILRRARVEDFTVDNDAGRSVTDVAREVLRRAGWL